MEPTDGCAVRETHISILLFLGEHVLKLRKPLRLDFADFSTPAARAQDCQREVDLNRRLAPDVYLGVAEVTMGGETLDHLVVMRRLPAERSLGHLVCSEPEPVWGAEMRSVARTLAEFHARADRSPEISACASRDRVLDQFEANVAATVRFVGPVLEPDAHDTTVGAVRRYLAGRDPLFTARIAAGQICDGHGDLQADDIYCLDDAPRILDCLEFDDRLRFGDVAADVAFLAMDLERLGHPEAAMRFLREYDEVAGAQLPPSLLHTYIALRAYVRVKVACIRHEQGNLDAAAEAVRLLDLAQAHLELGRIRLVLVGGLPGSGKSTLANALGDALGAIVLRSDEIRAGQSGPMADRSVATPFGQGGYTAGRTQAVYEQLIDAARQHLGLGQSVVLDASWIDASNRGLARALALQASADLTELRCTAPPAVTEERIVMRLQDGRDPSEATVEIGRAMALLQAPWPSATAIDTARPPGVVLAEALRIVGAPVVEVSSTG
jgi:aminoglycoside phosphotransferase family enzyme/predicted kinase